MEKNTSWSEVRISKTLRTSYIFGCLQMTNGGLCEFVLVVSTEEKFSHWKSSWMSNFLTKASSIEVILSFYFPCFKVQWPDKMLSRCKYKLISRISLLQKIESLKFPHIPDRFSNVFSWWADEIIYLQIVCFRLQNYDKTRSLFVKTPNKLAQA